MGFFAISSLSPTNTTIRNSISVFQQQWSLWCNTAPTAALSPRQHYFTPGGACLGWIGRSANFISQTLAVVIRTQSRRVAFSFKRAAGKSQELKFNPVNANIIHSIDAKIYVAWGAPADPGGSQSATSPSRGHFLSPAHGTSPCRRTSRRSQASSANASAPAPGSVKACHVVIHIMLFVNRCE